MRGGNATRGVRRDRDPYSRLSERRSSRGIQRRAPRLDTVDDNGVRPPELPRNSELRSRDSDVREDNPVRPAKALQPHELREELNARPKRHRLRTRGAELDHPRLITTEVGHCTVY